MSIEALRQYVYSEAANGKITVSAAMFTGVGLHAPSNFDALLSKAFLDVSPAIGLPIAVIQANVSPVVNGQFTLTGTIAVAIAMNKQVVITFAASGKQGAVLIRIDLGDDWTFGKSFGTMVGSTFATLSFEHPTFLLAGQAEDYPWENENLSLQPGLNFAGRIKLQGYLRTIVDLLQGFVPSNSYLVRGTLDPSKMTRVTPDGKLTGFPGLNLTSTALADGPFHFGYLSVGSPYLWITLIDLGDGKRFLPAVTLAAPLSVPDYSGEPAILRCVLSARKETNTVGFMLLEPDGGLILSTEQLFKLMAGQTMFDLVPPALSSFMQQFGVRSFGASVSYGNGLSLEDVTVSIGSKTLWQVFDSPSLKLSLNLDWTVQDPLRPDQRQYGTLFATAQFMPELFPGSFFFSIDTDLSIAGGYTATDPSQYVSVNQVIAALTKGYIAIPPQYVDILLEQFYVQIDQQNRSLTFSATTSLQLPVLGDKFKLYDVTLRVGVQRPQTDAPSVKRLPPVSLGVLANDGTRYTGGFSGSLVIDGVFLQVEASYADAVWSFDASLQPGLDLSLQGLLNSVFKEIKLPPDLFSASLSIWSVALQATVPSDSSQPGRYSGTGILQWQFSILGQTINTLATLTLAYDASQPENPYTGSVTATVTFDIFGRGTTFQMGYALENVEGSASKTLSLTWEGLAAKYVQGSAARTIDFTADSTWNLGRLINSIVRLVYPSAHYKLPSPWDMLNDISLAGLKISFELDTKVVSVTFPLPAINLFFASLDSLTITKVPPSEQHPDGQVLVGLNGNFPFLNTESITWDALSEDPPEVPGGGNSAFDLHLLALGQHVSVGNLAARPSISDTVDQMKGFQAPAATSAIVPIATSPVPPTPGAPAPPVFMAESEWLIGTHFYALGGTLEIKAIFNDPILYGLYLKLSGEKAQIFDGLAFEILYKKISDTVGMYQVMLQLPDSMRYLQFGALTVILPCAEIEIFTNGDFKVDLGFPYNLDFTRSFTIQVFPFTGSGGIYFGSLDGTTSMQVPQPSVPGYFRPVTEFGVGMQVGFGKSVSYGILSADLAVSVFGMLEGVIATWQPFNSTSALIAAPTTAVLADAGTEASYYHKITGSLGIIGRLSGSVDFAIIKATVNMVVYAYVQGVFESYCQTILSVNAGVSVSVSFRINLGLFSIRISFSFSVHVHETFTIGSDNRQDAPWYGGQAALAAPLWAPPRQRVALLKAVHRHALAPNFAPLPTPTYGKLTLDTYLVPHLSIAGTVSEPTSKEQQQAVYAVNLFVSNELRTENDQTYKSFERLMRDTWLWFTSSFSAQPKSAPDALLQQSITLDQLTAALHYLRNNADGRALAYRDISNHFAALFQMNVQLPPKREPNVEPPDATAFPMPPDLTLLATYQGKTLAEVDFATFAMAGSTYISDLQRRINLLLVQMLNELEQQQQRESNALQALLRQDDPGEMSLAQVVFIDYVTLAVQYLVQAAIDVFDAYAYPLKASDTLQSIFQAFKDSADSTFSVAQIAWANRAAPLTPGLALTIDHQAYTTQEGDTLTKLATDFGVGFAELAAAVETQGNLFDQPSIIVPGLTALTYQQLWQDITEHQGSTQVSGMASRFLLGGLRLPVPGLKLERLEAVMTNDDGMAGLQSLTGQQFPLPSLANYSENDPLTLNLAKSSDVSWLSFTNPTHADQPSQFAYPLAAADAKQVNDLLAMARTAGLKAPINQLAALPLIGQRARQLTFRNNILLQGAEDLPLPNNKLPEEAVRRPRIWNFPLGLLSELGRQVDLAPVFTVMLGSTSTQGGAVQAQPAQCYGFGTLVSFDVRRITPASADGSASPNTYELVGANQTGINLLERLLEELKPDDPDRLIAGMYLCYQPSQTSSQAQGLQYDGEANYATFLVQANLSTETNPPLQATLSDLQAKAAPQGLLCTPYEFVSRLWAGSIVRSGGYYFNYSLTNGNGLPDSLFNNDGTGSVSLLIVYNPLEGYTGDQGGVLKDFMNVAVVGDAIDPSNTMVYVESQARPASAKMTGAAYPTLQAIADAFHLDVIEIACTPENQALPLKLGAQLSVTDIVHQVGRGQTLADVAAYYGTTSALIEQMNPHVDVANLQAGTGLHIPDLVATAGMPGLTLAEIAAHYHTSVAALAWANRLTPGLFPESTTFTFADRLLDEQATLPAGNVGFAVSRKKPTGEHDQPDFYLEQQYNLLGYDLIASNDFEPIGDALPLPSGPTVDDDETTMTKPKPGVPLHLQGNSTWDYTFVVPAARAARNHLLPLGTATEPYPDPDFNPYAGVGGFVQIALDWRDMLGNHTWSRFDDPSPGNTYPLNTPVSRVAFTDVVLGLGMWPSTLSGHYFAAGDSPTLVIEWDFDPSRYDPRQPSKPGQPPTWQTNALADRQVFATLYYQLMQVAADGTPATLLETVTSLASHHAAPVSTAERSAVLAYVLQAWRFVDYALKNGGQWPEESAHPQPVRISRPIDPSRISDITQITVTFQVRRPDRLVLAEGRDADALRVSPTLIGPCLKDPASNDSDTGHSLAWYATQFQEAFAQTEPRLYLATGVPRSDVAEGKPGDTLWAVPFGASFGQAYSYKIVNLGSKASTVPPVDPAIYFAPAPLSTVPIHRPGVSLYSYTADGGLSPNPDTTQPISGEDLDVWAKRVLTGIDLLLSSQYAVPAFWVDRLGGTRYLAQILDTKYHLASAIALGVTNILDEPALDPEAHDANFKAAREALRQQLLIRLGNAYTIDAIVQYEVEVSAPSTATDPDTVPRLYGTATLAAPEKMVGGFTTSAYKLPLVNGSTLLTYTFTANHPQYQAKFPLTLSYVPTHIEHEVGSVAGIKEYQASAWLKFVQPPPAIALMGSAATVQAVIPIPLRTYPTPPKQQSQSFLQDKATADPTSTLAKAKAWTFRYGYRQAHAAQDQIDAITHLNVPADSGKVFRDESVDLVVMLARLDFVLADIQSVFQSDLSQVGLKSDPSSAGFARAQKALAALAELTFKLDEVWTAWVKQQEERSRLQRFDMDQQLPYSILEESIPAPDGSGTLILQTTVVYPSDLLPGMTSPPILTFDDYHAKPSPASPSKNGEAKASLMLKRLTTNTARGTGNTLETSQSWIYEKIDPEPNQCPYLTWDQALARPERQVDLGPLDAIRYQNAQASLRITRNLSLVPDNPTRDVFVYRTPMVQFANKMTPLLDTSEGINLAQIPSGTRQSRDLVGHLNALFETFFDGSPSQAQTIKLEVRYRYALSAEANAQRIELPMMLLTPLTFNLPVQPGNSIIQAVAQHMRTWYQNLAPATQRGGFFLDLCVFTSLSSETLPLVRIRQLELAVADVADL